MYGKKRFLAAGLTILTMVALFPVLLQSTSGKPEPQPLNGRVDNLQTRSGLVAHPMGRVPLAFTANRGQWDERALFKANTGCATMWFTSEGTYYQFSRRIPRDESPAEGFGGPQLAEGVSGRQMSTSAPGERFDHEPDSIETMAIKATFVGANPNPEVVGEELMEYKCNYFIGNDPAEWHTAVPNYRAVCLKEVYSGIDLRYYGSGKQLEYDFIVSPGADPAQIRMEYDGVNSISVNDNGELVVETNWTTVTEQQPKIYQVIDGEHKRIEGRYELVSANSFGFRLGKNYDPDQALIIDPVVLIYSTYLGGADEDWGNGIVVDNDGHAYVTGHTFSSDFPTEDPYQPDQPGEDAFVAKLNGAGNGLVYITYLGGANTDGGNDIAIDGDGCAYVYGQTSSSDFPTQNPYQTDQPGQDLFVTKLNAVGNALVYSTYLGGNDEDYTGSIAVDGNDDAYVTGYTWSSDFPTQNPYQTYQAMCDVFVTKFNNAGDDLVYSTYLGGSSKDWGRRILVDINTNAFIVGWTWSPNFPTQNPYQPNQPGKDVFVTKLNTTGDGLVFSTYLGGSDDDECAGLGLDDAGNVYVSGFTESNDFPTLNPYQGNQGGIDGYITKLNSAGNSLIYSTYLGGSDHDVGFHLAVDGTGNAHIAGPTLSGDFPIQDPYQTDQGGQDVVVAKLNSSGDGLVYSTYLGGAADENCSGIALDNHGNVYVTGRTWSTDFPTQNPFQVDQPVSDIYVTKLTNSCYCGVKGDMDNSGNADPLDVTYLVQYVYLAQDGRVYPVGWNCPYDLGDMNCDGSVDPLDVTYLVNYVYLSLDAICDGCNP
ncbi:SBBP repeat-containing protein [Candidatus Zixiibacteriota bacterium]